MSLNDQYYFSRSTLISTFNKRNSKAWRFRGCFYCCHVNKINLWSCYWLDIWLSTEEIAPLLYIQWKNRNGDNRGFKSANRRPIRRSETQWSRTAKLWPTILNGKIREIVRYLESASKTPVIVQSCCLN